LQRGASFFLGRMGYKSVYKVYPLYINLHVSDASVALWITPRR